jgi:hypothetical protein
MGAVNGCSPHAGPVDTAHRPRPNRSMALLHSRSRCWPSHVTGCQSVLFAELLAAAWRLATLAESKAIGRCPLSCNHVCVNGHDGLSDSAGVRAPTRANQGPLRRVAHAPPVKYHDFCHGRATPADGSLQKEAPPGSLWAGPWRWGRLIPWVATASEFIASGPLATKHRPALFHPGIGESGISRQDVAQHLMRDSAPYLGVSASCRQDTRSSNRKSSS